VSLVSSLVYSAPVRSRQRSRRRRTAVATATGGYFAAYGAGLLGLAAIFAPTGHAALLALAAALLLGVVTIVLLRLDALMSTPEPDRLPLLA
jgi:hypothetical protein